MLVAGSDRRGVFFIDFFKQKNALRDLSGRLASDGHFQKFSFPKEFNTFSLKITVFLMFFILFGRPRRAAAGSGRFRALQKSMKTLSKIVLFEKNL